MNGSCVSRSSHTRKGTDTGATIMSVGLPGTGLGAAFYMLGALWAPLRSMLGRGDRRSRGFGIALLAVGIIGAVALASVVIAAVLPAATVQLVTIDTGAEGSGLDMTMLLIALLSPFGTLALLLLIVRVGAAFMARSGRHGDDPLADVAALGALGIDTADDVLEVVK